MKIPTDLKHKPVIVVEDYSNIDGRSAYNTPTRRGCPWGSPSGTTGPGGHIRQGLAPHGRCVGQGSLRNCLLHRVLDLAILVCRPALYFAEAYPLPQVLMTQKMPVIDRVGLQGDAMTVAVCTENEKIDEDIQLFVDALARDGELIGERLSTLARILKELGY